MSEERYIPELDAIAAAMGEGWVHNKVQQTGYCHYLTKGKQCIQVMRESGSNNKRVSLSTCFSPYHPVNRDHYNKITVSLDRSPKALAADIKRRLLPGYAEHLQQAIDKHNESRQKKEMDKFIIDSFKKIVPLEHYSNNNGWHFGDSWGGVQGWIKQNYHRGDEISLELNRLSPEMTIKILALLRDEILQGEQRKQEREQNRSDNLAQWRERRAAKLAANKADQEAV
ncbi:hypothetical protein [Vibrio jasicida]|uniref:hypothetical protein n=1 Tax=Vibrio jasicida TaxID=766224 RepID=UPI0005EDFFD1|nr:hypothetical protein [Vibrio jasicida]